MSHPLLALIGAVPPFLLLWVAERSERRIREPAPQLRYRILVAAGFATVPILAIQHALEPLTSAGPKWTGILFESYVLAALVEEVGKFSCLWVLTRGAWRPGSRYGAFIYALHASMGFAIVENVISMFGAQDLEALTVRFLLRAYLSIPTHLVAGGLVGYLWARRRFDVGAIGLPGGLSMAILLHGSFNLAIYSVEHLSPGRSDAILLAAAVAVAIPLVGSAGLLLLGRRLRDMDGRDGHHERRRDSSRGPGRRAHEEPSS